MVTWIDALARTRKQIVGALSRVFASPADGGEVPFDELEELLVRADVPVRLAGELLGELQKSYRGLQVSRKDALGGMLTRTLENGSAFAWESARKPLTVLVVGVNGSGKTTTCAKLAWQVMQKGLKPVLGATDTFRAAGAEQLRWWAEKLGCEVVVGAPGADAAAVAYDALDATIARGRDVLIIDTAGRMHTKEPLMRELQKLCNALAKRMPGTPQEIWIVLDATLGQNAVIQAQVFHDAVPLTGAVVAKLDGSAKAGFVFSISKELKIPIRFAGLGEAVNELAVFEPDKFVEALLAAK